MLHFLTLKVEAVGWGKDLKEVLTPRSTPGLPDAPTLCVVVVYQVWGHDIHVLVPYDNSWDELAKLAKDPQELVDWALSHMDSEHSDEIANQLDDSNVDVYVNGEHIKENF